MIVLVKVLTSTRENIIKADKNVTENVLVVKIIRIKLNYCSFINFLPFICILNFKDCLRTVSGRTAKESCVPTGNGVVQRNSLTA